MHNICIHSSYFNLFLNLVSITRINLKLQIKTNENIQHGGEKNQIILVIDHFEKGREKNMYAV